MKPIVLVLGFALAGCQVAGEDPPPPPPPPPSSEQMTVEDVAAVAEAAGFACVEMLLTVVAIAVAESSLRPDAVNIHTEQGRRPDGTYHRDRGLWQISSYSFPQYSDAETFDPASAAAIVYELSAGGTDFSPWDSYTGGDVQRHIDGPYNG
jgi:hypothetical protein